MFVCTLQHMIMVEPAYFAFSNKNIVREYIDRENIHEHVQVFQAVNDANDGNLKQKSKSFTNANT